MPDVSPKEAHISSEKYPGDREIVRYYSELLGKPDEKYRSEEQKLLDIGTEIIQKIRKEGGKEIHWPKKTTSKQIKILIGKNRVNIGQYERQLVNLTFIPTEGQIEDVQTARKGLDSLMLGIAVKDEASVDGGDDEIPLLQSKKNACGHWEIDWKESKILYMPEQFTTEIEQEIPYQLPPIARYKSKK